MMHFVAERLLRVDPFDLFRDVFGGGGSGGFGSIFEDFFGGGSAGRPEGMRGNDLRVTVSISLEQASTGVEKEIKYSDNYHAKHATAVDRRMDRRNQCAELAEELGKLPQIKVL